jgi:iron complex transport system ATP-binding protein
MRLTVNNAAYHYDLLKNHGFKNVSFSLEEPGIMTILGPNGCGKTTLLKCLNRLLKISSGTISINDKNICSLSRVEIAKEIGYVPQNHQPSFAFSVLDAVLVGRAPYIGTLGSPKKADIEIAEAALETMSIMHLKEKAYTALSGGERQMVIFARILAQQPSLILLDEPTSHLDFGNQVRLLEVIQQLAANGLPIIMTSHFPDHAFLVSNKVVLMKQGELINIGTPDEIITEDSLEKVYRIKVKLLDIDADGKRKVCVPFGLKSQPQIQCLKWPKQSGIPKTDNSQI